MLNTKSKALPAERVVRGIAVEAAQGAAAWGFGARASAGCWRFNAWFAAPDLEECTFAVETGADRTGRNLHRRGQRTLSAS